MVMSLPVITGSSCDEAIQSSCVAFRACFTEPIIGRALRADTPRLAMTKASRGRLSRDAEGNAGVRLSKLKSHNRDCAHLLHEILIVPVVILSIVTTRVFTVFF